MKCLQSQPLLQGPMSLRFLSMMVDGQPKNMQSCCSTLPTTSMNGIKFDCKSYGTSSRLKRELSSYLTWRQKGEQAEAAEHEAHQRSIQEWEAQVKARELDNAALPCGPTPQGTSSMRALPNVHDALRQNDPKVTSFSQPVVKKAPPTLGRARPSAFYSDAEPPRIGAQVQPPPPAAPRPAVVPSVELPLAVTPMTPSHPPRPPLEALPKYPSMETSSCANKHPLEPPTAQAPPSKHVRCKAYPFPSQGPDQSLCGSLSNS